LPSRVGNTRQTTRLRTLTVVQQRRRSVARRAPSVERSGSGAKSLVWSQCSVILVHNALQNAERRRSVARVSGKPTIHQINDCARSSNERSGSGVNVALVHACNNFKAVGKSSLSLWCNNYDRRFMGT